MPTREDFDVVPLRKATKRQLAQMKGGGTYDAAIRTLLATATTSAPVPLERPRAPDEQLALADLAARRWRLAVRSGALEEIGPRLVVFRTGRRERRRIDVRVA